MNRSFLKEDITFFHITKTYIKQNIPLFDCTSVASLGIQIDGLHELCIFWKIVEIQERCLKIFVFCLTFLKIDGFPGTCVTLSKGALAPVYNRRASGFDSFYKN